MDFLTSLKTSPFLCWNESNLFSKSMKLTCSFIMRFLTPSYVGILTTTNTKPGYMFILGLCPFVTMFLLTTLWRVFRRPRVFSTASDLFMSLTFIHVIASRPISSSSKLFACFFFQNFSLYSYFSNNPGTVNTPFQFSSVVFTRFPIRLFSKAQNLPNRRLSEFQTRPKQYSSRL